MERDKMVAKYKKWQFQIIAIITIIGSLIFVFVIVTVSNAQRVEKKEVFKFVLPLFRKKGITKSRDMIKFSRPVTQKIRESKFATL
jgi:Na+-translocating ferredoxin:NAD+ oxidoreductase RnfG subunit